MARRLRRWLDQPPTVLDLTVMFILSDLGFFTLGWFSHA